MSRETKLGIIGAVLILLAVWVVMASIDSYRQAWYQAGYQARDYEICNVRDIRVTLPARGLVENGSDTYAVSIVQIELESGQILEFINGNENQSGDGKWKAFVK